MRRRSAIHEPAGRIDEDHHLHIRHFPGNIRRDLSFHDALSQIFHIGLRIMLARNDYAGGPFRPDVSSSTVTRTLPYGPGYGSNFGMFLPG